MKIGERVNVSRARAAAVYWAFLRRERSMVREPMEAVDASLLEAKIFVPDKVRGKRGLVQGKVYVLRKKGE